MKKPTSYSLHSINHRRFLILTMRCGVSSGARENQVKSKQIKSKILGIWTITFQFFSFVGEFSSLKSKNIHQSSIPKITVRCYSVFCTCLSRCKTTINLQINLIHCGRRTVIQEPFTYVALKELRKQTTCATSSGCPARPSGVALITGVKFSSTSS